MRRASREKSGKSSCSLFRRYSEKAFLEPEFWCWFEWFNMGFRQKKEELGVEFRPERKRVGYPLSSLAGYTGNS